jgi:predicted Zn-dependent protease
LDVDHAIRRRPAWATRQGLLPKNYKDLVVRSTDPDPSVRSAALERLGRLYWRISAFDAAVKIERRLLALHPQEKASRWRLADGLLQLGQPVEAHAIASALLLEDPNDEDIRILEHIARQRASWATENDDGA